METKTNVVIIGLLILILGLSIGYFAGTSMATNTAPVMTHQMPDGSTMSGDMQSAMDGMTMALQGKTGDELDKAFIDGMIVHHEGAVAMARTLLAGTRRPELAKLGNDIIAAQTGEIEMMQQWRRDWFGE